MSRSACVYAFCGWKVNQATGIFGDKGQAAIVDRRGSRIRWRCFHRSDVGIRRGCASVKAGLSLS